MRTKNQKTISGHLETESGMLIENSNPKNRTSISTYQQRLHRFSEDNSQNSRVIKNLKKMKNSILVTPKRKKQQKFNEDFISEVLEDNNFYLKTKKHQNLKEIFEKNKSKFFLKLFFDKLMRNNQYRPPVEYDPYNLQNQRSICELINQNSFTLPNVINQVISFLKLIIITLHLVMIPLSMVFDQVYFSIEFSIFLLLASIFGLYDIFSHILIKSDHQNSEKIMSDTEKARQLSKYFKSGFFLELLYVFIMLSDLISRQTRIFNYLGVIFIIKFENYFDFLEKIQAYFFVGSLSQKYWNLIKVFIKNLVICHFLAVILIAITYIPTPYSWMTAAAQIDQTSWISQYIYSYYFGVTIVTTIGFGDFHASNPTEALLLTFIFFFSTVFFGYNINYIGNLINSIKSEDIDKEQKLKTLRSLTKKANISKNVYNQISKYIIESSNIKKEFNNQSEIKLLEGIPDSLRSSFLHQTNERLFINLRKVIMLNNKSIQKLALTISSKICHPDETIKRIKSIPSLIILQNGEVGYATRRGGQFGNKIIQKIKSSFSEESQLICLNILTNEILNYEIKSIDYSIIYEMNENSFQQSLRGFKQDFQIYRQIKDKYKYVPNEFGLFYCIVCKNKKHTLFQCPKLHYLPIKQSIIYKFHHQNQKQRKQQQNQKRQFFLRFKEADTNWGIFKQDQIQQFQSFQSFRHFHRKSIVHQISIGPHNQKFLQIIKEEINKIKSQGSEGTFEFDMWDLTNCDEIMDYLYYLPRGNAKHLVGVRLGEPSDPKSIASGRSVGRSKLLRSTQKINRSFTSLR